MSSGRPPSAGRSETQGQAGQIPVNLMGVIVVTTQEDTGRVDAHRDCEDRDDRPLAGVDRYISEPMNAGVPA